MLTKVMRWTCVSTATVIGLAAQTSTPSPVPEVSLRTFGMIGLAESQTARVNLLNPGVAAPAATAAMCSASVSFLDAQGTVLKTAVVTVAPGQSQHLDVDSDADLQMAVDARREIRATILIPPVLPPAGTTAPQAAPCRLIPTLEIFDTLSGKTTAVLGHAHELAAPVAPTTSSN